MRIIVVAILCALTFASAARAEGLTVNQCMTITKGLRALDRVGQALDDPRPPAAGDKPYKLGAIRFTIAVNITALQTVTESFEKARNALVKEISPDGQVKPGTPEMDRLLDGLQKMLDKPCDVKPGRIKLADLKLGDGPEENAIPPSVLAALMPIIDQ